jgi:branched-chain amino acid transport system substrate-binding protein
MKKQYLGVALATIMLLGVGCAPKMNVTKTPKPIKIGFVGPLTGDASAIGQNTLVGAEIARDEINKNGGINGQRIELVVEDAKCDAKTAASAGQKLITIDKVVAIVGGLCSSETLALAPITETAHVPLISAGSSNPQITRAGDYTFRFYPSDSFQGQFAATYAAENLKAKKVALLFCQSDYCVGVKDEFKKKFVTDERLVVAEEAYKQGDLDMRTQLTKIKAAAPDLIYFPGYTEEVIAGLKQMRQLGITTPVLGTDTWTDPKIIAAVKQYRINAEYTLPANQTLPESFTEAMKERAKGADIIVSAPRAYDIMKVLAEIMKKGDTAGASIKQSLYALKDYTGIADTYTMDSNGDMTIANYEIKKILE